jgi:flagellar basal-body rod modification protein FlgD
VTPGISSDYSTSGTSSQSSSSSAKIDRAAAQKNMFLQLLVAQLRNQNPLNPSDGTQFVAQLAQFQQLEESLSMSQDIAAIRQNLDLLVAPADQTEK